MTAPAPAVEEARRPGVSWSVRLWAALGFLLAVALGGLFLSQQIAVERARNYARSRLKVDLDIPVQAIRPDLVGDDLELLSEPPPLGFCWTIEIEAGIATGEVLINPWNHEVVGWRVR
jgi:hypothetical protein